MIVNSTVLILFLQDSTTTTTTTSNIATTHDKNHPRPSTPNCSNDDEVDAANNDDKHTNQPFSKRDHEPIVKE